MRKVLNLTVLVASLGYFVDMFDLTIFGVVRVASLKELGVVDPSELTRAGVLLLNCQATGMLIGGLLWGVLADKKGRLKVLFGSILIYSLANFLNAFVTDVNQYAVLRLIAGIGLAGELGAAVTLVAETLAADMRGYGTMIVATLGLLGAVAASIVGQSLSWKMAYVFGGALGFLLLLTRMKMSDSSLFHKLESETKRGDLKMLFTGGRGARYLFCIFLGVPVYYITGVLFTFSPEIAASMGLTDVTAGNALLAGTIGLTAGDLFSGWASQILKSRKKAVFLSLLIALLFGIAYFFSGSFSARTFYGICFFLGVAGGYWAVLVTMAAEQFGTNIRGTVATSVPNFVRASVIPLTSTFLSLKGSLGVVPTTASIGVGVLSLSLFSLFRLRETFGSDLEFTEK